MQCTRCTFTNPDGARFCNQCGAPLTTTPDAPELKRLTVLFCDLVGSVELSSRLDPEDWHRLLHQYQETAGSAIRRHQGHVAQHLGDGLVAYFGYPLAAEGDALRAVQAALDLVAAVNALPSPLDANPLQVRVGMHSGAVVMGEVGSGQQREYLALGDTPNIAARLQALAPADGVLVSAATFSLVQPAFEGRDLGERRLKGLAAPLHVHQITARRRSRGDDERGAGAATPLLGRARELARLEDAWQQAAAQRGSCILILGEPGIGKSRLARELRQRKARDGGNVWLLRCSAQRRDSPFAPLAQLLERAIAAGAADGHAARADTLADMLFGLGTTDSSLVAPLADLLGIELPASPTASTLSAQALRERTFEAASALARAGAAQRPTLLMVEDLHWSDPSTLEWLGRLVARELPPGLMLLLTARSEFTADWLNGVERMTLDPCSADDAAGLVRALDPTGALNEPAIARIVDRAEGNPLYLEEFTRSALEASHEDIPATLQEQIMARLDRLGPAKPVLQQAAVIGRQFGRQRLRAVSGLADEVVSAALRRGVEAHLLLPLSDAGGETFTFRHALLQDAANASLLRSARQACHLRVAQAILAEDERAADHQPELLAHHYAEGGQVQPAMDHWLRAGQVALERSACLEAAAHVRRALALLGDSGDDPAAMDKELQLLLVLAPALMTVHGALDPHVERAYRRAGQLCERIGNAPKMLVPLWGLWAYELMRGKVDDSRHLGLQLQQLAAQSQQPMPGLVSAATNGMTLFYQGELASARTEFARGVALYGAPRLAARLVRGVHDPGVMCHAFDMLACRLQGDVQTARDAAARLRESAAMLSPYHAAFLWCADALLAVLDEDPACAQASARRAVDIAREQAFEAWQVMGSVIQGWGRAREEDGPRGLQQMQRSIAVWSGSGAHNLLPLFHALRADAWLARDEPEQARDAARAGLAETAGGERCWTPELQRLDALALHRMGQHGAALAGLQEALAGAGRMGALAWRERVLASIEQLDPASRSLA